MNSVSIIVAGAAGTGIESMAHSLGLSFTREGLFVYTASEYENRIRGGSNYSLVRVSDEELTSHAKKHQVMVAMDAPAITNNIASLEDGAIIIYDGDKIPEATVATLKNVRLLPIPANKMAEESGLKLAANIVAIGALFAVLERSTETFKTVIKSLFERKGAEVVEANFKALNLGYQFVAEQSALRQSFTLKGDSEKRSLLYGNEAIALGSIKAGLKFLAAYPMTPGSTIMTVLAKEARNYNVVVSHVEDEIAAVNMAVGAGYAGVRAATSTSGGGFALMGEAVSLAGMLEAPVVIFNAQRPGPSTGLPTRTAQGDLRMAMHCGQGDIVRLVLAAGDHEDCVKLSIHAFNLAERFQIPVIFLTEKYIADSYKTVSFSIAEGIDIDRGKILSESELQNIPKNTDDRFPRYADTEDGVSPRPVFGTQGGEHVANSYEHDAYGMIVEDEPRVEIMMEKRWKKLTSLKEALPDPVVYGEGDIVICFWGGMKGPLLEAQKLLKKSGKSVKLVQVQYLYPLKEVFLENILSSASKYIVVEGNQSGQLEGLIREYTSFKPDHSVRSYYGRQLSGEELFEKLLPLL